MQRDQERERISAAIADYMERNDYVKLRPDEMAAVALNALADTERADSHATEEPTGGQDGVIWIKALRQLIVAELHGVSDPGYDGDDFEARADRIIEGATVRPILHSVVASTEHVPDLAHARVTLQISQADAQRYLVALQKIDAAILLGMETVGTGEIGRILTRAGLRS